MNSGRDTDAKLEAENNNHLQPIGGSNNFIFPWDRNQAASLYRAPLDQNSNGADPNPFSFPTASCRRPLGNEREDFSECLQRFRRRRSEGDFFMSFPPLLPLCNRPTLGERRPIRLGIARPCWTLVGRCLSPLDYCPPKCEFHRMRKVDVSRLVHKDSRYYHLQPAFRVYKTLMSKNRTPPKPVLSPIEALEQQMARACIVNPDDDRRRLAREVVNGGLRMIQE